MVSRDDTNNQGFDAAGSVIGKSYDTIDVDVTESGKTYTATTYNYTGTSAYTVTYTSGAESAYTETDTWQDTESTTPVNYSNRASYSGKSSASWATVTTTSGVQKVSADSRGTTTGTSRSVNLYYKSTHDSSKGTTVTIPQAANSITGSTEVVDSVTSSITSSQVVSSNTEYSNVYVWFDVDGSTTLPASGGSVTIDAYESGRTRTVTVTQNKWDEKTTKHTVRHYSSGAESSTSPTTTTTSSWTTYNTTTGQYSTYNANNINERIQTSGDSNLTYDKSTGIGTAPNRGTTTGSSRTKTLSVTSEHDTSKTATQTFKQNANNVARIYRNQESYTESVTVDGIINVSPTTFTAKTGSMSTSITVKSAKDVEVRTGTTADYYDVYDSGSETLVGTGMLVQSGVSSTSREPVEPVVSWPTQSTYGTSTCTLASHSSSSYTYTLATTTATNPPTTTVSNGTVRFTNNAWSNYGEVNLYYSGATSTVYPTVSSVQGDVSSDSVEINVTFDTTNATPDTTWEFKISGHTVPAQSDGNIILTLTGKTNSSGTGVQNVEITRQDGSWYTDEFTITTSGNKQITISTPSASHPFNYFPTICTQQPRRI